ncbi:FUSC family protein (plasmid) [Paracoccus methylovorus]|uniref:FUSC family protein n=1 Tax=Paracoccus methylovorus TaxID=2812658 RepID=A0ABX7JLX3_9RHOB|nr:MULTISPECIES: FUSC family protein [Paracoccus]QRZ14506.1 FUSC family protein [Paracoccus methylovorus]
MSEASWLQRNGFDRARLLFATRTALACCLAVVVAWAMGLEHPQWSGMSVWAASQTLRGQLLEKGFFRFAGTLIGTVVGVFLVLGMQLHPAIMVAGLAFWVGLCTWAGNLQRGLIAYGTVLAGYSASMVALLDTAHPDQVLHLGADRLATVLTGVLVATLAGYFFAGQGDAADLRARIRNLLADLLRHLAEPAGGGGALLSRMAALEESLDPHAAGSLRSRREVRACRAVLLAALPLLLRAEGAPPLPAPLAARLSDAAGARDRGDMADARRILENLPLDDCDDPGHLVQGLTGALRDWDAPEAADGATSTAPLVVLHRDWIGAREAALRAGGAMLLFGAIWLVTGWSLGPFMLLGLSVMISLFSTFENPARMMRYVGAGQALGVIAAILCHRLLWPLAQTELQQILMLVPFLMLAPILVAHRRTVLGATDYSMILLLMSQPHLPLQEGLSDILLRGVAILAAPLTAWVGYRLIYPVSLQRRRGHLVQMMLRDLAAIARDPQALARRPVWQARLYHRALRLVRISERLPGARDRALMQSLTILTLAHAVMRCHELVADPNTSAATRRAAQLVCRRLERIASSGDRTPRSLDRLARRLDGVDAQTLRRAASGLRQLPPIG